MTKVFGTNWWASNECIAKPLTNLNKIKPGSWCKLNYEDILWSLAGNQKTIGELWFYRGRDWYSKTIIAWNIRAKSNIWWALKFIRVN